MIAAISFSDEQLVMITRAAETLPATEQRRILLERVASRLELCGHFVDADVEAALRTVIGELRPPKTARDAALNEIAVNPKWHLAAETGEIFTILGARPVIATIKGSTR